MLTLDGSSAACEWGEDPDSPPGTNLYGYEARPKLQTTDYVGNGNDSYWLTNADNPLTGFPVVFGWLGHENKQQSLRTRIGHLMVRERREAADGLDEAPGFTLDSMKAFMYSNRVYGAEIVLDDVLAICEGLPGGIESEDRAKRACATLAGWDRKVDPDSRGAQVFTEFWRAIHRELGNEFNLLDREPFVLGPWTSTPQNPLNTPRGIDRSRSGNRELVVAALSDAVSGLGASRCAPGRPLAGGAVRHPQRRTASPCTAATRKRASMALFRRGLGDGGYTPRHRQHLHSGRYLERHLSHRRCHPDAVAVDRSRITSSRRSDGTVQSEGVGAVSVLRGRDRGGADRRDGGG